MSATKQAAQKQPSSKAKLSRGSASQSRTKRATTSPKRRPATKLLGAESSATRNALIDATIELVREEGYAALTVRNIATKAGLKHQLIYYYFETLDDLLLDVLRRGAEHNRALLADALSSEKPLESVWKIVSDLGGSKFTNEFMALANHNEAIRAEIARHWNELRRMQVEALARYIKTHELTTKVPPVLIVVLMSAVARLLVNETSLGIELGHDEAETFVENWLRRFDQTGEMTGDIETLTRASKR